METFWLELLNNLVLSWKDQEEEKKKRRKRELDLEHGCDVWCCSTHFVTLRSYHKGKKYAEGREKSERKDPDL
jgi:hypothetical protein